ncbi:tetratricopeptide repeat protein [Kribbella kalugense]|uniref:TIR domain-containing protein n=1 Tax=Kribbella kalugense TaxID=2512221 RepID=A0A4R7ZN85_9ACTN|nr:toll/interleukin-1 receptor domain-containing protein [Kribbella kalugense]TDW18945.1 TIR domain-containing protein [Kribbella kalugense]
MAARHDVFLCYKWEDQESAEALRIALVERGLRVFRDEIGLEDWDPLTESIQDALRSSRTLVALVTPRFPISPHCRDELHQALTAAYSLDSGSTRRVLAVTQDVAVRELRPRELKRFRLPRDGRPPAELADTIARKVSEVDGRSFGDAPALPVPAWWPEEVARDPFFRGRGAELWDLHESLRAREKNDDLGQSVVAVRASGGEGKTDLCLQYARWFARDHPGGVFVIRLGGSDPRFAGTDLTLRSRYLTAVRRIAEQLALYIPPGDQGPLVALRAMLSTNGSPYLWLVDDVPSTAGDSVEWMSAPTALGKTLLTTRGRFNLLRRISEELDLGRLDPEAARGILTAHTPARNADDRRAVADLVTLLDAHPLGLRLAAGLTVQRDFAGYPDLLTSLSAAEPDGLELATQFIGDLGTGLARSFSRVLIRSFDTLDPDTQQVLSAASVLSPAPIPMTLIEHIVTANDIPEALGQACVRGLMTPVGDDAFVMHALTARAIRIHTGPAGRDRLRERAVGRLTSIVEAADGDRAPGDLLRHLPHVRAVVGLLPGGDTTVMSSGDHHLLHETGRVQVEYDAPSTAVASFTALHDACLRSTHVDAMTRYAALVGLSVAVGLTGDLSRALELKQRAIADLECEVGENQPETWTARSNLAVSYFDAREFRKAHEAFRDAYQWRYRSLGPSHRETLIALGNLAIAYAYLDGSPTELRRRRLTSHRLLLVAQSRWQLVASADDPAVLDVLNSLALSHRRLGRPRDALELTARVYAGRASRYGETQPDTLDALENLILLQHEVRDPDKTFQDLFLRRLVAQGPAHPSTMTTMLNLLRTELARLAPAQIDPGDAPASAIAEGDLSLGEVRLDRDHVDLEIELTNAAVDLQAACVAAYGSDDSRTMAATAYLAYCQAVADHLDGNVDVAAVLADDAYGGLADCRDDALDSEDCPPEELAVLEREVEIAQRVRNWINQLLEDAQE